MLPHNSKEQKKLWSPGADLWAPVVLAVMGCQCSSAAMAESSACDTNLFSKRFGDKKDFGLGDCAKCSKFFLF